MDPSMLVQYPDVITKQFAKFVSLLLFDVTTFWDEVKKDGWEVTLWKIWDDFDCAASSD